MNKSDLTELRGVFPRDGGWGHKVVFRNFQTGKVHGWLTPIVSEGDRFGYQMESGKIGVFEFTDVDNQSDPRDMFFGKVGAIGYAEDLGYDL